MSSEEKATGLSGIRKLSLTNLRAILQPGDIMLALSNNQSSVSIATTTGSQHSHASIWSGELVIEATFNKVREAELAAFINERIHIDVYRHNDASGERAQEIVRRARSYVGHPFCETDLAVASAIGIITAWLKTGWLSANLLDQSRRLRALLSRLSDHWHFGIDDQLTCVALAVRSHLDAELPIEVKLNPRGQINFAQLRAGIQELLEIRKRANETAGGASDKSLAKLAGAYETVGLSETDALEFHNAALEHSLRWLEQALEAKDPVAALADAGYEASEADLKKLVFVAGDSWPAGLVTPVQLTESVSLQHIDRVRVDPPNKAFWLGELPSWVTN